VTEVGDHSPLSLPPKAIGFKDAIAGAILGVPILFGKWSLQERPVGRIIESQEALLTDSPVHRKGVPFTAVPHPHRT